MPSLAKLITRKMPDLQRKLAQARIQETPERYVQRSLFLSVLLGVGICVIIFLFMKSPSILFFAPFIFALAFLYLLHYADARVARLQRDISKEIVFAGRFLIIELESGVPLYDAFHNIARNYEVVGQYFAEVIQRVDLGTGMEDALNEAVMTSPSNDLRRMLWQVLNSLKTGSEIAPALNNVFDQIVREQEIAVKEYGRKLNPLAMFYMMIAIIVPSLGTIMVIVMSTFIGIDLNMLFFSLLIGVSVIVQFMFLSIIRSQRPPVDL